MRTEGDDASGKIAAKLRDVFVIRVQHRGAGGGERLDQLVLGAGDVGDGIEEAEMHRGDAGHDAGIGLAKRGQRADFAGVVHAEFNYRELMFRFEAKQLQRQSVVIVEIALGLEHTVFRRQQARNRFLGGGLARRTGDRDHGLVPHPAHGAANCLQRNQRVGDGDDAALIAEARRLANVHHGAHRARSRAAFT